MASINDCTGSPTILSLANEVKAISHNILRRTDSLADCLGGVQPESEGDKASIDPTDLHGILQRVLSTLRTTQDELTRSEKVIGLVPKPEPVCGSASAGKTAMSVRY